MSLGLENFVSLAVRVAVPALSVGLGVQETQVASEICIFFTSSPRGPLSSPPPFPSENIPTVKVPTAQGCDDNDRE